MTPEILTALRYVDQFSYISTFDQSIRGPSLIAAGRAALAQGLLVNERGNFFMTPAGYAALPTVRL